MYIYINIYIYIYIHVYIIIYIYIYISGGRVCGVHELHSNGYRCAAA
jgi:hypothetical protein